MQHGNMQQGEAYRNNHSHRPKVFYLFWSALDMSSTQQQQQDSGTAGQTDTTLGQSDSGCPADCLIRRTQYIIPAIKDMHY